MDKNYNTSLINMYVLSSTLTLLPGVALPAMINRLLFILVEKQVLEYVETTVAAPLDFQDHPVSPQASGIVKLIYG